MRRRKTSRALVVGLLTVALGLGTIAPAGLSPTVRAADLKDTGGYVSVEEAWARAEVYHPSAEEARRRLEGLERDLVQREAAYAPGLTASVTGLTVRVSPDGTATSPDPGVSLNASLKLRTGMSLTGSLSSRGSAGTGGNRQTSGSGGALRGSVGFSYPLFRPAVVDSDALALRQAETALVAASREFEQLMDEVRADILAALHQEQVAALRLELAREAYGEAEDGAEAIRHRVELGIAAETDLIGARIDLLRAEQEAINATRTWQSRRGHLLDLLGLQENGAPYEFENVLDWTRVPEPPPLEEALPQALQYNVSVWERMQAEEVAALQLEAERARPQADVSLSGSYNTRNTGSDQQPGWQVGVGISYPLLDGGQRQRTLASREEAYQGAREAREAAVRAVEEQVKDAYVQLTDARRDVEIAGLELTRAQLELEQVQRQAALPVAVVGEETLRQSERALLRAEMGWRESVQRYQARWIALQRMLGPVDWMQLVGTDEEGSR